MTKENKKEQVNIEEVSIERVNVEETNIEQSVVPPKETASRKTRTRKRKPKVDENVKVEEVKDTKTTKYSVTVYSKPNCPQCDFTKRYLDDMGTPYNNVDITQDKEALEQLRHHGYLGVPVVAINSLADSWGGFRPDELEKLRGVKE